MTYSCKPVTTKFEKKWTFDARLHTSFDVIHLKIYHTIANLGNNVTLRLKYQFRLKNLTLK